MNKKEERNIIYNKYNGKCAYCGCELSSKWHVDHFIPIIRDFKYNKDKTKFVYNGNCKHPELDNIENKMPSCPSCNIMKKSLTIESFRNLINGFVVSLNRDSTQYKFAKKYNLISETNDNVLFYFEKFETK